MGRVVSPFVLIDQLVLQHNSIDIMDNSSYLVKKIIIQKTIQINCFVTSFWSLVIFKSELPMILCTNSKCSCLVVYSWFNCCRCSIILSLSVCFRGCRSILSFNSAHISWNRPLSISESNYVKILLWRGHLVITNRLDALFLRVDPCLQYTGLRHLRLDFIPDVADALLRHC